MSLYHFKPLLFEIQLRNVFDINTIGKWAIFRYKAKFEPLYTSLQNAIRFLPTPLPTGLSLTLAREFVIFRWQPIGLTKFRSIRLAVDLGSVYTPKIICLCTAYTQIPYPNLITFLVTVYRYTFTAFDWRSFKQQFIWINPIHFS